MVFKMDSIVSSIPYIDLVKKSAIKNKTDIWLVGGYLRDRYLKKDKELRDFDFCVEKNIDALVKDFSRYTKSKIVILDDVQKSLRVIVVHNNNIYTFDFTAKRSKSLRGDLQARDFTINSLAISLFDENKLIDLCGSISDLKKGIIRSVSGKVFVDDPLRIVRGFAFMANYGFKIERKTLSAMVKHKNLLNKVSGERLGGEILKVFHSTDCFKSVRLMDKTRILDVILPDISAARGVKQEGGYHHLDVWNHSMEALKCFDVLYKKISANPKVVEYLDTVVAQGHTRLQIVKLACLLHDIGKPSAKAKKNKKTIFYAHEKIGRDMATAIIKRLRLSGKEGAFLKGLIFWHLRPGYLADQTVPTQRAVYRFFRDTGVDGVAVVLLSLADWYATRGPKIDMKARANHEKVMLSLVYHYFDEQDKKPLPKLINGYDIMKALKIGPSPMIGVILKAVNEAQALGKIATRQEALGLSRKAILKKGEGSV